MKRRRSTSLLPGSLGLTGLLLAAACSTGSPRFDAPPPSWQPFGSVWIDAGQHALMASGFVNQVSGAIELLACGPGGKTHESVLVLMAKPSDLHAGLLLLGLRHGPPMADLGKGPPVGDRVRLDVEWEMDGAIRRLPAERWIRDRQTKRTPRHGGWVFNGSTFHEGKFMADAEQSIIACYWDPWAIVNIAGEVGADDERLAVQHDIIPPLHTPVRLIIRPESKPAP